MNYLESNEYKYGKSQLQDEYAVCFNKIETYIKFANIYGLYQEACLLQILDDFLSAQAEGKEVANITGSDVKKYCNTMIQAEKNRTKSKLDAIAMLPGIPFIVLFLALLTTSQRINGSLSDVLSSITISAFSLSYPILYMIYYMIKWKIAKTLFNHTMASKIITTFVSVIILVFVYMISGALDKIFHISIPIPFPLFISVFMISLSFLIVIIILTRRENKKLKIIPESEDFIIEQVTCLICGEEYDMDYPRCPYCKNKNEEL